ncbi:hypothetical protein G7046_g10079 [Stylonectria norvegica]|nr:hypothetical protein G7046_g10079 [Stylonectria norvegica]
MLAPLRLLLFQTTANKTMASLAMEIQPVRCQTPNVPRSSNFNGLSPPRIAHLTAFQDPSTNPSRPSPPGLSHFSHSNPSEAPFAPPPTEGNTYVPTPGKPFISTVRTGAVRAAENWWGAALGFGHRQEAGETKPSRCHNAHNGGTCAGRELGNPPGVPRDILLRRFPSAGKPPNRSLRRRLVWRWLALSTGSRGSGAVSRWGGGNRSRRPQPGLLRAFPKQRRKDGLLAALLRCLGREHRRHLLFSRSSFSFCFRCLVSRASSLCVIYIV